MTPENIREANTRLTRLEDLRKQLAIVRHYIACDDPVNGKYLSPRDIEALLNQVRNGIKSPRRILTAILHDIEENARDQESALTRLGVEWASIPQETTDV